MRHVVVVDDAETNVDLLSAIVETIPDTVAHPFTVSNDALAYAGIESVDAFVLDHHMPEPDGRAMIRLLRADPRFSLTPIVIVTGEHDRDGRLEALQLGANDYIERPVEPPELRARLDTLLTLHAAHKKSALAVDDLERSLHSEERRSRWQAERMIALWRIVSNPDLTPDDVLHAILHEASRAIRPHQPFYGNLTRVDGDEFVFEATSRSPFDVLLRAPGDRVPCGQAVQDVIVTRNTTLGWPDASAAAELTSKASVRMVGMRAVIGTPFRAGRSHYVLLFWSREATDEPFTHNDFAYVELLAGFFAARLQDAWQSERITHHLSHDSLTGLRNRTQFRVEARAAHAVTTTGALAVVALDRFRHVNDTFGHIIGDAVLVEVAAALESRAAAGEIVGRLGSDTFGIFLPLVTSEAVATVELDRFMSAFDEPFSTGDRDGKDFLPISATMGAVVCGDMDDTSFDTLLAHADIALFEAKRSRRGDIAFYRPDMESEQTLRERFSSELASALERQEFELYFQPHIDLRSRRVAGAEALIRWNHPVNGLMLPGTFIPFAEQHGFITSISRWVMKASIAAAERFRVHDPEFRVYFNLSAFDLTGASIVDAFRDAAAGGAHLENVGVELTETAAMQDVGATVQTIKALRELGVAVAIDDFGTGYSSLSLLKRLPVDIVKIDRSFINDVVSAAGDAAIAEAVIRFGEHFQFRTLGEGVETREQLAWLDERNCHFAQGNTIAPPQSADAFERWLVRREPAAVSAARRSP